MQSLTTVQFSQTRSKKMSSDLCAAVGKHNSEWLVPTKDNHTNCNIITAHNTNTVYMHTNVYIPVNAGHQQPYVSPSECHKQ